MMTMMAAVMMSTAAFAQDCKDGKECKCSGKKGDKTEMVKHRTDKMVEKYGLNDQQAAQLLDLNTKYADKLEPRGGHRHHHGPKAGEGARDKKEKPRTDAETGATAQPDSKFEARPKEHEADRKAYEEELQKIMTAEQYEAYQADMKKHKGHGPKHHRR